MDTEEKNPLIIKGETDEERQARLTESLAKKLSEAKDAFDMKDFIHELSRPLEVFIPMTDQPLTMKFCRLSSSEVADIHDQGEKDKLPIGEINDLILFHMVAKAYPDQEPDDIRVFMQHTLPNEVANFAGRYILRKASVFFTQEEEQILLASSIGLMITRVPEDTPPSSLNGSSHPQKSDS